MDAHRFLTLADQLLTGVRDSVPSTAGDGAPECRCATSRAYYAAYNVAVEFLGRIGFETTNSHNCHHAVQFAFNQSGNASLRTVSANLNSLHSERKVADYEMRNTLSDTYPHANSIGCNRSGARVKSVFARDFWRWLCGRGSAESV